MDDCLLNVGNEFGIVLVIVTVAVLNEKTDIPTWLLIIPVTFLLYKILCLDSIFFNKEKTGIVSMVLTEN